MSEREGERKRLRCQKPSLSLQGTLTNVIPRGESIKGLSFLLKFYLRNEVKRDNLSLSLTTAGKLQRCICITAAA